MKIDNKILEYWKKHYEHGDYIKVAKFTKLSRLTIFNAFKYGRCSSNTLVLITNYYKKKEKLIKNLKT